MSGKHAIRGFVVQTLCCITDALDPLASWDEVRFEPDDGSEKIDIIWRMGTRTRITQVKSSQNPLQFHQVKRWVEELEAVEADERELMLVGPLGYQVARHKELTSSVQVPHPRELNERFLNGYCAFALHAFVERGQLGPFTHFQLLGLVAYLSNEILLSAVRQKSYTPTSLGSAIKELVQGFSSNGGGDLKLELEEIRQFKEFFGFEPTAGLRRSITAFYFLHKESLHRHTIKAAREFLYLEDGRLTLRLSWTDRVRKWILYLWIGLLALAISSSVYQLDTARKPFYFVLVLLVGFGFLVPALLMLQPFWAAHSINRRIVKDSSALRNNTS